ncbi:MAG: Glycerol-3-phosphate dehydrogenase [Promethearchaeota archaeon]|nr:MAG: Glycerol-3-phosphate dehydrogenase [Candidatus Lokiarchaeota archaeon]
MNELVNKLFNGSWNFKHREAIVNRIKTITYDIIVIGGGITGAGVAREATMRGLKVCLLEKQDFAAGTSSRSSKLAHGGIRYLGQGEMGLVKEATTERNWMRHHCTTVRPIPFLFVAWEGEKYKMRDIKAATKMYDFLSDRNEEFKNYKKRKILSPEKVVESEPEIKKEGNNGGVIYYDNNVDDARLTIETLKEAVIRGADIINYCEVMGYLEEEGTIKGVQCKDLEDNKEFEVKTTLVVNATGIWTDELLNQYPDDVPEPLIRPTKGVHLVYKQEHVKNKMATIITSITDRRAFFVLPRGDFTIIGTTDTDYKGDLANPYCNKEDADYLITSVKHYFPTAELEYKNLLATYAGIRPLVREKGVSESDVSRKHIIFFNKKGLLTISGGKLTTWRKMAEDLFEKVEEKQIFSNISREKDFSKQKFSVSMDKDEWEQELQNSGVELEKKSADYLYRQYERGALKIIELIKDNSELKTRILEGYDFIKAEILYLLRHELTPHLIDVFCRRTEMSLFIDHRKQKEAAQVVAGIMAEEYKWSAETKEKEVSRYVDYIKNTVSFI